MKTKQNKKCTVQSKKQRKTLDPISSTLSTSTSISISISILLCVKTQR